MQEENKSEVARMRAAIHLERQSYAWAIDGLSEGSSQHKVITARMMRDAGPVLQLFEQGRGDDAVMLWNKMIDAQRQQENP
jgi:hypothetical protein